MSASLAYSANPLVAPREGAPVPAGVPFSKLAADLKTPLPLMLRVNGEWISRAQWELVTEEGDVVEFHGILQNSGSSRGILQIVLIVAAVAYGAYTGDWATAAKIYAIGNTAISLLNVLVPLRQPTLGATTSPASVYNLQFAGNQARLLQPIPVIYGRMKTYPDLACQAYGEYVNNEQFSNAIYCIGQGTFTIEQLFIANSPFANFADLLYNVLPPGAQPTLVLPNVYNAPEAAGQDLATGLIVGGFPACPEGKKCTDVAFDIIFATGLAQADSSGNLSNYSCTLRFDAQQIDDFGTPIGDWFNLNTEVITRKTLTPQRISFKYHLATAQRVQCRASRVDTFNNNMSVQNSPTLGGLRGYLAGLATQTASRVFAWYDAAAGTSSAALLQAEYAQVNGLAGSMNYYTSPPDAEYWSDIRPQGIVGTFNPVVYVDAAGLPVKGAVPGNYGCVVYDAANSNFFALGPEYVVGSTETQNEYRLGLDGSVISTTPIAAPMNDQVGAFPRAMVFFNGHWRAWGYSASTNKYVVRAASTPTWTLSTTWLTGSVVNKRTVGAVVIGGTLVLGLVDGSTGDTFFTLATSTDGTTWSYTADYDITGGSGFMQALSPSLNGGQLLRIGSLVGMYLTRAGVPYVIKAVAGFATCAISALTLDGGAPPSGAAGGMGDFVANAAGSYVVGTVWYTNGAASVSHLVVSTDGIAFTTVSDANLLTAFAGAPLTNIGQFTRPLLAQGTKFLYERSMNVQGAAGAFAPLSPTATHLEVRVRATSQLNQQTQGQVNVNVRRKLRTWSPTGGWTAPVESRSIAWALADKWSSTVYGDGLPDARIDLATLYALDQVWSARQDRLDILFDSSVTSADADVTMAQAGRARPFTRAGVRTLFRDQLQTLPVTAFTSRNMLPGMDIGYSLATEVTADGVIVEYFSNRTWAFESVTCPAPGVLTPVNAPRVRILGITGTYQATREGLYQAAQNLYRRKFPKWQTELAGLLPPYGSMVLYAPDLPGYGQAGDVVDFNTSTLVMTLTEQPVFVPGASAHYISLQRDDGSYTDQILVLPGPVANQVQLGALPDFTLVLDDGNRERPKYIFGVSGQHRVPVIVLGIAKQAPDPQTGAQIIEMTGVNEDVRIHAVDNAFLPGPGVIQDPVDSGSIPISGGGSGGLTVPVVTLQDHLVQASSNQSGGGVSASFTLGNLGVASYAVNPAGWPGGGGNFSAEWLNVATDAGTAGTYEVRATLVGLTNVWLPGQIGGDNIGGAGVLAGSAATGVWLNLGTSRTWSIDNTLTPCSLYNVGQRLLLEIRSVGTTFVLAARNIDLVVSTGVYSF